MMRGEMVMLIGAWIMFGCMAVVALMARRRSKKIDRWMAEDS
jgi:hypothetical protein